MGSLVKINRFEQSGLPLSDSSMFPDIFSDKTEMIHYGSNDTMAFLFLVVMVMIIAALFCFKSEVLCFLFSLAGTV